MAGLTGDRPAAGVGSWRVRRAFLFVNTAVSMGVVAYVLANDMRGAVAETAVVMAFANLISSVGAYVFGAAWQDISTIRTRGAAQPDAYYPESYRRPRPYRGAVGRVDDPEDDSL